MMTLERRHKSITVLKQYFLPKRLHSTKSYFIKAIDHTFYGFTGVITHLGCWENTKKACKSRAEGSWFTSFSRVLPTSRVCYHAGKPIESVVYCLNRHACYRRPDLKRAFLDFLSSPPLPWPLVKGRIRQIPIGHFQVLNTFTFKGRQNLSSDNDFNLHKFHINCFALGLRPSHFFFVKRQMRFLILGRSVGLKRKT